jgi:hypothetical protein
MAKNGKKEVRVGQLAREETCGKPDCKQLSCLKAAVLNELREQAEGKSKAELEEMRDNGLLDELAVSFVPIHNWDLLENAQEDLWLSCSEPENLAFDGQKTAVNAIAGVIFDSLSEALYEEFESILEGLEK